MPSEGTDTPKGRPSASTIQTTAFTLVKNANGTATLTINPKVLLEPGTLQNDLRQDGIPAIVTTGSLCYSDPKPSGFSQVVHASMPHTLTINPAAMPAGTELSFGNFQTGNGEQTTAILISTGSYTCASTPVRGILPGGGLIIGENHAARS